MLHQAILCVVLGEFRMRVRIYRVMTIFLIYNCGIYYLFAFLNISGIFILYAPVSLHAHKLNKNSSNQRLCCSVVLVC
jgi:hypothetical protein